MLQEAGEAHTSTGLNQQETWIRMGQSRFWTNEARTTDPDVDQLGYEDHNSINLCSHQQVWKHEDIDLKAVMRWLGFRSESVEDGR